MSRLFTTTDPPPAPPSAPHDVAAENCNGKPEHAGVKPAESNGKPAEPTASAQAKKPEPKAEDKPKDRVERAEELTDKIAVNVALFASTVGRGIVRAASHVGETLSDMWAEAQNIRKSKGK